MTTAKTFDILQIVKLKLHGEASGHLNTIRIRRKQHRLRIMIGILVVRKDIYVQIMNPQLLYDIFGL